MSPATAQATAPAPAASAPADAVAPPRSTAAPRRRGRTRSVLGWIALALAVGLAVLIIGQVSARQPFARGTLDPEAPTDAGALALAEILRDRGVDVVITASRTEAAAALDDDTTLAMADPFPLSDEAVTDLVDGADRLVLLSASSRMLRLLELGDRAGSIADTTRPDCAHREFEQVGTIRPTEMFDPAPDVTGCFRGDDGTAAVLVDERGDRRVSIVEGGRLFSNAALAEDGNAALALALLAQTDRLVWYVPWYTDSDIEANEAETLADRTPEWVTPAIVLLLVGGVVATIARGRRFGPLVAETLPVTVRASETMHGRARLTAKAADAAHAASALQEGTRRRLAVRLGLAARARPDEIADAAADRLRVPRGSLTALLGGPVPTSDAELIDFARRLAELEAAVDAARERKTP